MRQAPRHLAPGLRALRRDDVGDVVEHEQARLARQQRAARQQRRAAGRAALEREGVLPALALGRLGVAAHGLEALEHGLGEGALRHRLGQPLSGDGPRRQLEDAGRARVGGVDAAVAVEHDHAGGQVVQDGLQARARGLELGDAALDLGARVGDLLRHRREGACQPTELVGRGEHRARLQVAGGDLAHAIGQQQQRARDLVAQHDGQQHAAEDGQHKRQGQRAQVHAAQRLAREGALLVLAVGRLDGQRVGGQRARQRLHQPQEAALGRAQRDLVARHRGQDADARRG